MTQYKDHPGNKLKSTPILLNWNFTIPLKEFFRNRISTSTTIFFLAPESSGRAWAPVLLKQTKD
jgi:hypothetical protein